MARIAVATGVWGRLAVTRVFYAGVKRLREQWAPHEVSCYAAGDEPEQEVLAAEYGAVWVPAVNDPLGAKLNASARAAWEAGADYLVFLGSDNLLSPDLAAGYLPAFSSGFQFLVARQMLLVEPSTRRALAATNSRQPLGPGRTFGRRLLDILEGEPFSPTANRGLDGSSLNTRLRHAGYRLPECVVETGAVLDIKSETNLWDLNHFLHPARLRGSIHRTDYAAAVARFPERELIRALEPSP